MFCDSCSNEGDIGIYLGQSRVLRRTLYLEVRCDSRQAPHELREHLAQECDRHQLQVAVVHVAHAR